MGHWSLWVKKLQKAATTEWHIKSETYIFDVNTCSIMVLSV